MNPLPYGLIVGDWLSFSETFIHDQVVHQDRLHAHVLARQAFPGAAQRFPYADLTTLGWPERKSYRWLRRAPSFELRLRDSGARFIHAHFGTNGAHALDLADKLALPLAVTFHGHDVAGLEPRNRFRKRYFHYQRLRERLFERASLLLCSSRDLADRLVQEHGAPAARIVVHHLGIDLQRFCPVVRSAGTLRVLMVGRMVEKKGMEYGILAFARARRIHADMQLTLVGDGPRRRQLEALATAQGLGSSIRFTSALSPDGVRHAMHEADVLMAPSVVSRDGDRESGILVAKEAAATGMPVIGTWHGGIPDIIEDERTGYLVAERDADALSERLLCLRDAALRERLGAAAIRKMHAEYDTRAQNRQLEQHLLTLVASAAHDSPTG